jgi:serine/threonine-protein kinase
MSSAAQALSLPERLGRYELVAKLASGGMASVYLGRAVGAGGFERVVAIKLCRPELAEDPAFRTMFLDEARLAARIHHPNVVATIDVSDGDALYLVMDYVEGGRVSDLITLEAPRGGHVPIAIALRVLVDALSGLHAAHTALGPSGEPLKIVHRDVSPQNVLVGVDGVTRVVDFGVAKAEARATTTGDNEIKGKLAYMAPEQVRSAGVTARSDLFAAAIVAWELLTGARLFAGDSKSDVLQRVLYAPIPKPRSRRPEIPVAIEAVVLRALSREPAERFADAREFAEAIEGAGAPIASPREVGDYVASLLADRIEGRRAALRGLATNEPATDVQTAVSGVLRTSGRGRRRTLALAALAAVVLLVAGIGLALGLAMSLDEAPAEVAAPPPPASAVIPEPTEPAHAVEPAPERPAPEVHTPEPDDSMRPARNRRRPRMRGEFEPPTI